MSTGKVKNLKINLGMQVPKVVHPSQIDPIDKLSLELSASCKIQPKVSLVESLKSKSNELLTRGVRQLRKIANYYSKEGCLPQSGEGYDSTIKLPSSTDQLDLIMDPAFLDENILSFFIEESNFKSRHSLEVLKLLLSISAYAAESYLLKRQPNEQSLTTFTSNFYHLSARKICSKKLTKHLIKALFAIDDKNNPIFVSVISIFQNFAIFVSPITFSEILISIIGSKVSALTIQLCHILVTVSLLPNEKRLSRDSSYFGWIKFVVNFCKNALNTLEDQTSLVLSCNILMIICEKTYGIELVLDACVLNKVIELAKGTNEVSFSALSILAKMAFIANSEQIVELSQYRVPDALMEIISNHKTNADSRARACNALGNLGCETQEHVERLISLNAFPTLISTFKSDSDYNTKIEAAYAICACASRASQDQVEYIISAASEAMGLYVEMLDILIYGDASHPVTVKLCKTVLCALENIFAKGLQACKKYKLCENPYVTLFKQVDGIPSLLKMEAFPDYNIAIKSKKLIEKYI